jgi:trehalose synthase
VEEIRELPSRSKGKRVVHLIATAFGGGVSEILYTLIPLMRDVGLEVEWQVIYGREEFFNATKLMHNALQGNPQDLTEEQWATWSQYNEMNARELSRGWDVCIVHDPQPRAMLLARPEKAVSWVWRCHIDISTPNPATLEQLLPYIVDYPASLFHVAGLRARRDGRRACTSFPRDRPADAEEHGALARRSRCSCCRQSGSTRPAR